MPISAHLDSWCNLKKTCPTIPKCDVPKLTLYARFCFLPNNQNFARQFSEIIQKHIGAFNIKLIKKNPKTIGSLFPFKDRLCPLMKSGVVYEYKCPGCNSGNYVGSTRRLLKVRADSHMGVSYRTGCRLSNPDLSNIRSHARGCKTPIKYDNFKIIGQAKEPAELLILESLNIKRRVPTLNCQSSAVPLFMA